MNAMKIAFVGAADRTYGNRNHPPNDADQRLGAIIRATVRRGGSVLLPSLAVGRAQAQLHSSQTLRAAGKIPLDMPVYVDSPMAIQATALYRHHRRLLRLSPR